MNYHLSLLLFVMLPKNKMLRMLSMALSRNGGLCMWLWHVRGLHGLAKLWPVKSHWIQIYLRVLLILMFLEVFMLLSMLRLLWPRIRSLISLGKEGFWYLCRVLLQKKVREVRWLIQLRRELLMAWCCLWQEILASLGLDVLLLLREYFKLHWLIWWARKLLIGWMLILLWDVLATLKSLLTLLQLLLKIHILMGSG